MNDPSPEGREDGLIGRTTPHPPDPSDPPPSAAPSGGKKKTSPHFPMEVFGWITAPTTLLTALVFYFGAVRMNGYLRYFALDPTVLDLSTRDYILRSIDGLFVPLGVLLLLGLAATVGHTAVLRALASDSKRNVRRLTFSGISFVVAGVALLVAGALAFVPGAQVRTGLLGTPASLAAGCLLAAYGAWLYQRLRAGSLLLQGRAAEFARTLVVLFIVLNLFWLTAGYAGIAGSQRAQEVGRALASRPAVTVYSAKRLQLDPSVDEVRILGADSAYSYQYEGLRLLMRSGGQYVLLSDGWTRQSGVAILLPVNGDGLRFEFRR